MPGHVELRRLASAGPNQLVASDAGADADEQRFLGWPDGRDGFFPAVGEYVVVYPIRCPAQRQFAQSQQIAFAEKVLHCSLGLLRYVDLAFLQAPEQFFVWQIDQNDFVGTVKYVIRHRFPDLRPGNAADDIVQTLQMLDVDRSTYVDAGAEQLLDILPAFGMA